MEYAELLKEKINRLIEATVDYKITVKHHLAHTQIGLADIGKVIESIADEALNDNIVPNAFAPKIVKTAAVPDTARRQPHRQQAAKANSKPDDEEILRSLSSRWQQTRPLYETLTRQGFTMSKNYLYERLRKMIEDGHPIEEASSPTAWRLTAEHASHKSSIKVIKARRGKFVRKAKAKPRAFDHDARLRKLVESLLTNEGKTADDLMWEVQDQGFDATVERVARVLDQLERAGAAIEVILDDEQAFIRA